MNLLLIAQVLQIFRASVPSFPMSFFPLLGECLCSPAPPPPFQASLEINLPRITLQPNANTQTTTPPPPPPPKHKKVRLCLLQWAVKTINWSTFYAKCNLYTFKGTKKWCMKNIEKLSVIKIMNIFLNKQKISKNVAKIYHLQ